jgi:hypothetical protein
VNIGKKLTGSHGGRILLTAIPVAAVMTVMGASVAQGAVPVSFSISGTQFQVGASLLEGTGFSQYGGIATDPDGTQRDVAIANIASAKLTNLCQSVVSQGPNGPVGVLITAGGEGTPAAATDLQIGMTDLKGDASFGNIRIGVDASTVATKPHGSAGDFAQDADTVTIKGLQQTAWTTSAGVFTLTDMHLELTDGSKTCF